MQDKYYTARGRSYFPIAETSNPAHIALSNVTFRFLEKGHNRIQLWSSGLVPQNLEGDTNNLEK